MIDKIIDCVFEFLNLDPLFIILCIFALSILLVLVAGEVGII